MHCWATEYAYQGSLGSHGAIPEHALVVELWHVPLSSQDSPAPQVPQLPPQVSPPHCLPLQAGDCTRGDALVSEVAREALLAQVAASSPLQPSFPHCFRSQLGRHDATHWLLALQAWEEPQAPQLPPQPSLPHCFPAQAGVHVVVVHAAGNDQGCPDPAAPLCVSGSSF